MMDVEVVVVNGVVVGVLVIADDIVVAVELS